MKRECARNIDMYNTRTGGKVESRWVQETNEKSLCWRQDSWLSRRTCKRNDFLARIQNRGRSISPAIFLDLGKFNRIISHAECYDDSFPGHHGCRPSADHFLHPNGRINARWSLMHARNRLDFQSHRATRRTNLFGRFSCLSYLWRSRKLKRENFLGREPINFYQFADASQRVSRRFYISHTQYR